ncbi:probable RNA-binding protein EIF1AD isoform X1 [Haliaeetus albicilla]|uniref:probable RNA-binding protein EIF1AD isoform X1 n=1 Tax=Haliaeetus albicilla TaxID=8969 RepID=UPI0037E89481
MSRATKRKHVVRELLEERVLPAPRQRIVRVLGTPGNNLHEVETAEGTRFLASMPPRFRRHIWIKRGDFLLVDPIEEGTKVKAEMSLVLLPPHVRFLQRQGLWPEAFTPLEKSSPREGHLPAGDGDEDLFVNTNRVGAGGDMGDSEDTGDEDDTGDDEDDTGDEDAAAGDSEDRGDNNDDTGDKEDMCDKDTHPRDSGDKDRGASGSRDRRCPPQ